MSWTMEHTKYLLNSYEAYPTLCIGLNFVNQFEKDNGLKQIASQMQEVRPNTTPNEVKARLESLILQFKEEKNKEVLLKGKGETYHPTLWCYKQMSSIYFNEIYSESLSEDWIEDIEEPRSPTSKKYLDPSKLERVQTDNSNSWEDIPRKSIKIIGKELPRNLKKENIFADNFVDYIASELSTLHPDIIYETKFKIVNVICEAKAKSSCFERSATQESSGTPLEPSFSSSQLFPSLKQEHPEYFDDSGIANYTGYLQ